MSQSSNGKGGNDQQNSGNDRSKSRGRKRGRGKGPKTPFENKMLEMIGDKPFGFLREVQADLAKGDADPFCPPPVVKRLKLRDGVILDGTLRPGRKGDLQVDFIDTIMGMSVKDWKNTKPFDSGQIIFPNEMFTLAKNARDVSMRMVELVAPLGKGQRALIVAPPRTGKTMMLKGIASGLEQNHPDVKTVALLVDERPEEVTDFKRNTPCQVFASSNDRGEDNHVRVATLALEYSKRLVEMGHDVVLLIDSLTRLGRSFNLFQSGSGRTLSGGLDAAALKVPRKIFGSARNIEGGGSLTIIATALVDTGSRMDQVIFEEFKGTGNSEITLDREMADKRIFPAITIRRSGTRNEEQLLGNMTSKQNHLLRVLNSRHPVEATQALIRHIQQTPSNEDLLNGLIPSEYA